VFQCIARQGCLYTYLRKRDHILRVHTIREHVCPRCELDFFSEKELTAHLGADVKCESVGFVPRHDIDRIKRSVLPSRSRKGTPEEKWNEIYRAIFPDTPDDAMPSPCK